MSKKKQVAQINWGEITEDYENNPSRILNISNQDCRGQPQLNSKAQIQKVKMILPEVLGVILVLSVEAFLFLFVCVIFVVLNVFDVTDFPGASNVVRCHSHLTSPLKQEDEKNITVELKQKKQSDEIWM